ncbi:MAG: sugar phosphate isomerase/epimerase [Candidatus Aenigmarchaeota archaeon]|nr:sugar phosphate isomerase/epimerase [Candidatus Aenigmarchaeota archaeon]
MGAALPKLGNSTNPRKEIVGDIETIAGMGFDFAELVMEAPQGSAEILNKKANSVRKTIEKNSLFATAHAPASADLGHFYQPVRDAWIEQSKKIVLLSDKIGVKKLNFHANYSSLIVKNSDLKEIILDNHVESFSAIVHYARKFGIEILLENTIETAKDVAYIAERVKGLRINVDVGHAFIGGGNKAVINFIKTFRDNLSHLHFHDNNGRRDDHLSIGQGKINFPLIVKELQKTDYSNTINFEVFTKNRAYAKHSMNIFKKMWSSE